MNYLESLRAEKPELNNFTDDAIIANLPQYDPARFGGKSLQEVKALALQDNNVLADTGRLIASGAVEAVADITTGVEQLTGNDWQVDDSIRNYGQSVYQGVDPQWRKEISEVGFEEGSNNTVSGLVGTGLKGIGSMAPYAAAALVPGGGALGAVAKTSAVSGTMIGGGTYQQTKEALEAVSRKELSQSPLFRELYSRTRQQSASPEAAFEQARAQMIETLTDDAFQEGLTTGAVSGAILGPAIYKMLRGGQGFKKGVTHGAITEGAQETVESGAQALSRETALAAATGQEVDSGKVAREAAFGGLMGAGVGGTVGGATGLVMPKVEPAKPATNTPEAKAEQPAPAEPEPTQAAPDIANEPLQGEEPETVIEPVGREGIGEIDKMITSARQLGFHDEVVRLTVAKKHFADAELLRVQGNHEKASKAAAKGNAIVQDVMDQPVEQRTDSNQMPQPYDFTNAWQSPEPVKSSSQQGRIVEQGPGLGITDQEYRKTIFGEEPEYVTAAREQRKANHFGALYGQEGQANFTPDPALEGELVNDAELPIRKPAGAQLTDQSFKRLPKGTGQIDLGRDKPERKFEPVSSLYEGVGRNIVERRKPKQPLLNSKPSITPDAYRQTLALYQKAVRKKVKDLDAPELKAIETVRAVKQKEMVVSEQPTNAPAAVEKPVLQSRSVKNKKQYYREPDPDKDDLLSAIALGGGINRNHAEGVDPADYTRRAGGIRFVFPKTSGRSLDEMTEYLRQFNYVDSVEELQEKLDRALRGEKVYVADSQAEQDELLAEYEARIAEEAPEDNIGDYDKESTSNERWVTLAAAEALDAGVPMDVVTTILDNENDAAAAAMELENETNRARAALSQRASNESAVEDSETQEIPFDTESRQQSEELSDEEIDAIFGAPSESEDSLLNSYTEEELSQKEQDLAQAEQEESENQKRAEQKQASEKDKNDFVLTGSDLPADQANARGQNDLFADDSSDSKKSENKEELSVDDKDASIVETADLDQAKDAVIEDFGEKLGGARKDQTSNVREKLDNMDDEAIANTTLSQLWPKSEIDAIQDIDAAAVATVARGLIPAKPRKAYRLKRWVETVRSAQDLIRMLSDEFDGNASELIERMLDGRVALRSIGQKMKLLTLIQREHWPRVGKVELFDGTYYENNKPIKGEWINVVLDNRSSVYRGAKSVEDIADKVASQLSDTEKSSAGKRALKFEIRLRTLTGQYFIHKKGDKERTSLKEFDELSAARSYLRDHNDLLVKAWDRVKDKNNVKKADTRSKEERARVGEDYRKGKDVTPTEFSDAFGFRGVEFGNWVKQGKGAKERQGMLNQTYDALMDLSALLDIPPTAISLEGRLGIGLGSRGQGGRAAAHYEPERLVINLTKTQGAGSLAHEWFHALDNYFSLKRGKKEFTGDNKEYREGNYITYKPEPMMRTKDSNYPLTLSKKKLESYRERHPDNPLYSPDRWIEDPDHKEGVRPVIEKAFAELVEALDNSPMTYRSSVIDKNKVDGYWSQIIERAARAFESYVIVKMEAKNQQNDFLANVVSEEDFLRDSERYPYLKRTELKPVEDAFDKLFDSIESKETEEGTALFSRSPSSNTQQSLSVKNVKDATRTITKRLKLRGLKVNIVASEQDLPESIQRQIAEDGAHGQIKAAHHDQQVYLVADRMLSEQDVEEAVLHEGAHYGGRALFGSEFTNAYRKLYSKLGGTEGIRSKAKAAGFNMDHYIKTANDKLEAGEFSAANRSQFLVDEFLAHLNQQQAKASFSERVMQAIKAFVGAVRDMLRQRGFKVITELNDADLAYLLRSINRSSEGDHADVAQPQFMRVSEDEKMNFFFEDLADSFNDDAENAPMFSRTAEHFDDLDANQEAYLNKIGPKGIVESTKERVATIMDRWRLKVRQQVVDRYAPLHEVDQKARGKDVVEDSIQDSSWVLARMANAADGALSALLNNGRIRYDEGVIDLQEGTKGLIDTLKALGDSAEIERFMGWIAANRAQKLADEGRENLFTDDEIAAGIKLNQGETKSGADREALYDSVFEGFQQHRDDVLAIADKAGLLRKALTNDEALLVMASENGLGKELAARYRRLDKEFAKAQDEYEQEEAASKQGEVLEQLQELLATNLDDFDAQLERLTTDQRELWANEFYVPFYRIAEEEDAKPKGPRVASGLSRQEAYKKLKGGTDNLDDLLGNTLMNFNHLITASMRNMAAAKALENAELAGVAEMTTESARDDKSSTFVLKDGHKVWYDISDPLVYRALISMSDSVIKFPGMNLMRQFKRVFTNFTTASPQFIAANFIRDTLQAAATSEVSGNVAKNAWQGAKGYGLFSKESRTRARMMASGGAFSFGHVYGSDADTIKLRINGELRKASIIKNPLQGFKLMQQAWDKYHGFSDRVENINRAALYEQNIDKGKLYASFKARDLMDFSQRGMNPAVMFLIDTVPFLNARIQGLDKLYRSGARPLATMAKGSSSEADKAAALRFATVTGALTMATIALYLANREDEDYQALEDWQKDTYWFFKVGDEAFTIPKPFEVGAIATLAERSIEQIVDDSVDAELFLERLGHMVSDTFSFNPIPQIFRPLTDVKANKDSFTGRAIESMGMERLSPSLRSRNSTGAIANWVSYGLENTLGAAFGKDSMLVVSPVQVDYMIRNYLGWLGVTASATIDTVANAAQGVESPSKEWTEYQPIRRFYRDTSKPFYTRYQTEFYESLREVNRLYSDVRQLQKLGKTEEAVELASKNTDLLRRRKLLTQTQRKLSAINARMQAIERSSLSGDMKRKRLDILRLQKNELVARVYRLTQ
ncbi:MAG: LPD38 domain-containing protein [Pontibacterium sp.]